LADDIEALIVPTKGTSFGFPIYSPFWDVVESPISVFTQQMGILFSE
jgi:hypothetical protein